MKSVIRLVAVCSAAATLASSAFALTWQDHDSIVRYLGEGQSYTGEFRLLAPSDTYNPAIHVITSAKVGFAFADDARDVAEYVDIWIDATKLWNNLEVSGTHPSSSFEWHWQGLNGSLLGQLQDGILSYTVKVENTTGWGNYGDTWLKAAHLKAWGEYKRVPDSGATLSLLGLGLLGLAAVRKRSAK